MQTGGMTILYIEIVNNRKIRVFQKVLNGDNMAVAGDTGTGKTTAISALWDILDKRSDPITHGKAGGYIKIKVGNAGQWIMATRNNTPKTSTISLVNQDGESISIKTFKQMISDLSVNPHKIIDMKPAEQASTLLQAADLGVDLAALDREIADLEAKRLDAYRKAELLKVGDPPERVTAVVVSELVAEKDRAEEVNRANEAHRKSLSTIRESSDAKKAEAEALRVEMLQLRARLKAAEEEISQAEARITRGESFVAALKDMEISPIIERIKTAEETNRKATLYHAWEENSLKHQEAISEHAVLDSQVKDKRDTRKAALANAKWPLEGLSVEDGEVAYFKTLISNLGTSEQMLVCAALSVKDILAHPLRVVRMDGVESMSKQDFERLRQLFNGHGIQVLSTRVSRGDVESDEIVIVDGEYEEASNALD